MDEYIKRAEYCEKYCRCNNDYCNRQSCPIWKAPAADVASVRPELRKAVDLLHKNYEKALNSSYVRNPIAWALYHTWKKMDENNRRRC